MSGVTLTPAQLSAARALLGWTQIRLASKMGISAAPISNFERTGAVLRAFNPNAVREVLEAAGVEFIDENSGGAGARLRKSAPEPIPCLGFERQ